MWGGGYTYGASNLIYVNQGVVGTPTFGSPIDGSPIELDPQNVSQGVALANIDDDSDLDVLVVNEDTYPMPPMLPQLGESIVYRNNFTDGSLTKNSFTDKMVVAGGSFVGPFNNTATHNG